VRRAFWGVAICCLIALWFLTAGDCGAESPQPAGTVTIATANDVPTLDPNHAASSPGRNIFSYIYQAPTFPNFMNWKSQPYLAESWECLDPLTWKFKLRKGIKFHNGQPLTSADLKFSIYRIIGRIDPKYSGAAKFIYQRLIDEVETPDDYTVIVRTKYPEVSFIYFSGGIFVVPQAYTEKVGDKGLAENPMGTGPFVFKGRKVAESISLEAFPDYWFTNPPPGMLGPSKIKTAVFRIIPKLQTRVAALKAGEVDVAHEISPDMAKELEKASGIKVHYGLSNQPFALVMNWRAEKDPKTGRPNPFRDVRVRKAMNHAVDVSAVIQNYLTGRERLTTMVGYGSIGYDPDVPRYEHNPEKARELLAEAGYPHGFSIPFWVTEVTPTIEALSQSLRNVGIKPEYNIKTNAVIMRQLLRKRLYGVFIKGDGRGPDTAGSMFQNWLKYEGVLSLSGQDEAIEALVQKQAQEFDESKRAAIIHQVVQKIWQDAWYVPLWEPVIPYAISDKWDYTPMETLGAVYLPNLIQRR